MDYQAQLQALAAEVVAANAERREALQSTAKAWSDHNEAEAKVTGLTAEVRQLKAEIRRLNPKGLFSTTQTHASHPERSSSESEEGVLGLESRKRRRSVSADSTTDELYDSTPPRHMGIGSPGDKRSRLSTTGGGSSTQDSIPSNLTSRNRSRIPVVTIGVYVFSEQGEVTVTPLDASIVPQTVVTAVYDLISYIKHPENIQESHKGGCRRQKLLNRETTWYYFKDSERSVHEVACGNCTYRQQPCSRASGQIYDIILAPQAEKFRSSVKPSSSEHFVSPTQLGAPAILQSFGSPKSKERWYTWDERPARKLHDFWY
ncbi:uncharacterized protein LTR77_009243 [Saxophila tyrrhenica]|uniref:Uncharacterized protein n=1 Tax=Saxophila tyrrhenica TaxID=1690608 RepID=A0AAV9NZ48_9PEZI|nr:hypothetical protein LTR77_009243 [Saxophila tyrrhenica]